MASKLTKDGLILPDTGDYKQEKTVISVEGVEADNQGRVVLSSDQDKTLDQRINLLEAGSGSGDVISGITHIDESEYGPTKFLGKFDVGDMLWYGPHITFTYDQGDDNKISQWSRGDILDILDTPGGGTVNTSASDDAYEATTAAFHIVSIDTTNRKIVLNRGSHISLLGWHGDSWIQVQNEKSFGQYVYLNNLEIPQFNNGNGFKTNLTSPYYWWKVRTNFNYASTNHHNQAFESSSLPVDWTHIPSTATHLLLRTISKTEDPIKIYNRDLSHRGFNEQLEDYELVYHNQGAGSETQVTNLFLDHDIAKNDVKSTSNETYTYGKSSSNPDYVVSEFQNFKTTHDDKYKLVFYSQDGTFEVVISDLIQINPSSNNYLYLNFDDETSNDAYQALYFIGDDLYYKTGYDGTTGGVDVNTNHPPYRIDLHNTSGSTTSSSSNVLVDEFWVAVDSTSLKFINSSSSNDGWIIMYPIAYCSVGGAQYSSLDSRITNLENNSGSGNGTVTSINNVQPDSNGNVTIDVTGPDNVVTNLFLDRSLLEAPTGVVNTNFLYGPSTQSGMNHTVSAFENFKTNSEYTSAYMLKVHSVSGNYELLIDDLMNYNNGSPDAADSVAFGYDNTGRDIGIDAYFIGNDLIIRVGTSTFVEDSSDAHVFELYRIDLYKYADPATDVYSKSEVDSLISSSGDVTTYKTEGNVFDMDSWSNNWLNICSFGVSNVNDIRTLAVDFEISIMGVSKIYSENHWGNYIQTGAILRRIPTETGVTYENISSWEWQPKTYNQSNLHAGNNSLNRAGDSGIFQGIFFIVDNNTNICTIYGALNGSVSGSANNARVYAGALFKILNASGDNTISNFQWNFTEGPAQLPT